MKGFDDLPVRTMVDNGSVYVSRDFGGEAIGSLGKSVDFAHRRLDGIINVVPLTGCPVWILAARSWEIRRSHQNIPFLTVAYDGFADAAKN